MEPLKSINPYNGEELASYPVLTEKERQEKVAQSYAAFQVHRNSTWAERSLALRSLAQILEEDAGNHAPLLSREMGKPLAEAKAELQKCAWLCRYYAEKGPTHLAGRSIETDAESSYVRYDPLGPILGIMPWNYPFWQVFRFAVPAMMAGNVALLKHAPNVQGCAQVIEALFQKAGFHPQALINLPLHAEQVQPLIEHPQVRAVSLTGSVGAGSAVASLSGKMIKKTVLELGGSNAFIIFPDADLEQAADLALSARMKNNAQSCIAAKRFLVPQDKVEEFAQCMIARLDKLKVGDPLDPEVDLGPLARVDLAEKLEDQVKRSVQAGAQHLWGDERQEAIFPPVVLTGVKPGMPAFDEELFGPVVSITGVQSVEEAIAFSNSSVYGLGLSLITADPVAAEGYVAAVEDGAVFINDLVKSDPRLPFGGTKNSGYGRELAAEGIREFVNVKTVYRAAKSMGKN